MKACLLVLLALGAFRSPALAQQAIAPDTARAHLRGGLHEELQRRDRDLFGELLEFEPAFRDSTVSAFESLGVAEFRKRRQRQRPFDLHFDFASELWTYNRSEGLVLGAGSEVGWSHGPELDVQYAYAFGSSAWRTVAQIGHRIGLRSGAIRPFVRYADRVVPYGSNRPFANGLRALVGAADAQDYLRRTGGQAGVTWWHGDGLRLEALYDAARERSVGRNVEFAVVRDLEQPNAPVDEGIERAVEVSLHAQGLGQRVKLDVGQRISGGALAGDFGYNRTDVVIEARHYVLGNHELQLRLQATRTGGDPPLQRLADAGGLSTVRGFDRRGLVGEAVFAVRCEYLLPYDPIGATKLPLLRHARLQLVPWADAAHAWDGGLWATSLGLGVQRFLGAMGPVSNLRLDVAFPIGPLGRDRVRLELGFMPF